MAELYGAAESETLVSVFASALSEPSDAPDFSPFEISDEDREMLASKWSVPGWEAIQRALSGREIRKSTAVERVAGPSFGRLRASVRLIEDSDLPIVPLYRPQGVKGDILPLYDIGDVGNLAELRQHSGLPVPEVLREPPTGELAEIMYQALGAHPQVELRDDRAQAISQVASLYARAFEAIQKQNAAAGGAPSGGAPVPPGANRFMLTVETQASSGYIKGWLIYVKAETAFGHIKNKEVRGRVEPGLYDFARLYQDAHGNDIRDEDGHAHDANPYQPVIQTVKL